MKITVLPTSDGEGIEQVVCFVPSRLLAGAFNFSWVSSVTSLVTIPAGAVTAMPGGPFFLHVLLSLVKARR